MSAQIQAIREERDRLKDELIVAMKERNDAGFALASLRARVTEYFAAEAAMEAADKNWPHHWTITPATRELARPTIETRERFRAAEAALRAEVAK